MKYVLSALALILVAGGIYIYASAGGLPQQGDRLANEAELLRTMQENGYVRMGQFNPTWPATVSEVVSADDGIRFQVKGRPQNIYEHEAYVGYRFVFVRLSGEKVESAEAGYVFKTRERIPK